MFKIVDKQLKYVTKDTLNVKNKEILSSLVLINFQFQ